MADQPHAGSPLPPTTLNDFVCVGCGCLCDDLTLTVENNRVTAVEPPCPAAQAFLLERREEARAACVADGQGVELSAALDRAAAILRAAVAPLVMGLERATTETQRAAIKIADLLGGVIDPTDDQGRSRSHAAIQTVGAVTATFGEVAARADLVVFWGIDPVATHPRRLEQLAGGRRGASGASPRRMIVVATSRNATSQAVDEFLQLSPGSDVAALWTLRALVRGLSVNQLDVESQTGAPVQQWEYLAQRLKMARYAAIFYDPPISGSGDPDATSQSITELLQDLHRHTRAVGLRLGATPNAAGAAQALTWQTGFPAAVDFSSGYPSYRPDENSAVRLLERGEVDAALVIGSDPLPQLSPAAQSHLRSIPTVVVDDRDSATARAANVAILSEVFGLETAGSVYRSDGVALPLRPAIHSKRPSAQAILEGLTERIGGGHPVVRT